MRDIKNLPTPREYALMAQAVYSDMLAADDNFGLDDSWERLANQYPEGSWGLGVTCFINQENKQLVISVRGTVPSSTFNLLSNFGLFHGQIPPGVDTTYIYTSDIKDKKVKVSQKTKRAAEDVVMAFAKDASKKNAAPSPSSSSSSEGDLQLVDLVKMKQASMTVQANSERPSLNAIACDEVGVGTDLMITAIMPLLALAQRVTVVSASGAVESLVAGVSLSSTNAQSLLDEATMKEFDTNETQKALKSEALKDYHISFTGHSLGACIAEVVAARFGCLAVTFDSPGTLGLINKDPFNSHKELAKELILSFLSAPNLINCCNQHAGRLYRLYISHVENGWTYSHAVAGVAGTLFRLGIYTAVAASGGVAAAPAACYGIGAGVAGAAVEKIGGCFDNIHWTLRQHSIKNLTDSFSSDSNLPIKLYTVEQWPTLRELVLLISQKTKNLFTSFIPMAEQNRGIHNSFKENAYHEARIEGLSCYKASLTEDASEIKNKLESNLSSMLKKASHNVAKEHSDDNDSDEASFTTRLS